MTGFIRHSHHTKAQCCYRSADLLCHHKLLGKLKKKKDSNAPMTMRWDRMETFFRHESPSSRLFFVRLDTTCPFNFPFLRAVFRHFVNLLQTELKLKCEKFKRYLKSNSFLRLFVTTISFAIINPFNFTRERVIIFLGLFISFVNMRASLTAISGVREILQQPWWKSYYIWKRYHSLVPSEDDFSHTCHIQRAKIIKGRYIYIE